MGAVDAERIQKADRIVGHVLQPVRNVGLFSGDDLGQESADVRRRQAGKMRRLANVPVVEPDDPEPLGGQPLA